MLFIIICHRKGFNRIPKVWELLEVIFKYLIEEKNWEKGHFKARITNDHKLKCLWESSMNYKLMDQGADEKLWKSEDWLSDL